jgi:ABC-type sugar transport system, periplasmic component
MLKEQKAKLVAMLMLVFCLVSVAACSSSPNNGGGTNAANDSTPPSNQNDNAEPAPPEPEPTINMNGETLKILHWSAGPQEDTPEGALTLEHWKKIEEKYNVKIVWEQVPWGESIKMVTNAALTGEAVADIVALDYYQAIPAIKEGLFMPIDGFFDFSDPKWPANMEQLSTFKGHQYGFTNLNNAASGLYFNKTLLEREGLPNPHDLVAQGKWNWDTFLDIAVKTTKDTDGDDVIDQWGIVNIPTNLMRILIHSNGGALILEKDGKYVFANEDPNTMEAIQFFSDLYNVHRVVKPPRGETYDFNDYNDSQTLFSLGKAAFVTGELWEGEGRKDMTDEQGFVYFPKGPKRQDSWQGSVENYIAYYIPANVKRAQEKAKIWEDMQMWDRAKQNLLENAEKQRLSDERDIEVMVDMPNWSEPVFLPLGGALSDVAYSIAAKGESPETAMERNKQVAQDDIDKYYN